MTTAVAVSATNPTATANLVWSTSDRLRLKLKKANGDVPVNKVYEGLVTHPSLLHHGLALFDEDGDEIQNASFIHIEPNFSIEQKGDEHRTRYYFNNVVAPPLHAGKLDVVALRFPRSHVRKFAV